MKKNLMKLLALVLCLIFICPAALAQEGAYVIGEPMRNVISSVLGSGQMLTASAKLGLKLDAAALGLSEEEAAQLDMMLGVLDQMTLTGGAGLIEDGVRLTLKGELADEANANAVAMDAALNLTLDGLSLESDLIPGRRITANWETILALCGAGEEEITSFAASKEAVRLLMETDMEQAMEELLASLMPVLEFAAQVIAPYAGTIGTFVASLPMEMEHNLNEEGYPPTATEISVVVTQKDMGDLLTLLCDQAEQDETLKQMADPILMAYAEGATLADLISELRAAAAQMTDTTMPIVVFIGVNEDGVPMYLEAAMADEESGESIYFGLFCYEDENGCLIFDLNGGLFDADGTPIASFGLSGSYDGDPADPNFCGLETLFYIVDEGESVVEFYLTYSAVHVEDSELPAYDITTSYSMFVEDGGSVVSGSAGRTGLTAAGGEISSGSTQMDSYIEDSEISMTASAEMLVEPTADGGLTGYYRISESMPYAYINDFTADVLLGSEAYDPAATAALTPLALETITSEQMDALTQEVYAELVNVRLVKAMELLPAQVVEMIAEAAQ